MAHPSSSSDDGSRVPLYATIAVVGTLGGVAAIGYYSVAHWFRPPTPMVLAVTALLLPLVALNTVVALISSGPEQTVVSAIRPAMFTSVGIGLLGVGAGAAWMSIDVRQHGLDQAADRGLRGGVVEALEDPADPIVVGACQRLFDLGITGHRQPLLDLLDRRPDIARECLTGAADDRSTEIGQVVTERWHDQLLSESRITGRRQCVLARELPRMPRAAEAGVPALLSCAFRAPTDRARSCCTKSLEEQVGTGADLADALGHSVVRTVAERLGPPLVQASLHRLQLSDTERDRADRLGLNRPEMQRYVAGFACAYALNSRRTNDVTDQLSAWRDARSCEAEITRDEQNINAWHRVCRHLATRLAAGAPPGDLICEAVDLEAVAEAQSRASDTVIGALAGAHDQFMQAKILAGIAMKRKKLQGRLAFLNSIDRQQLRSGSALSEIMSAMDDPAFRERIEKIIVAEESLVKSGVENPETVDDLRLSEEAREDVEEMREAFDKSRKDGSLNPYRHFDFGDDVSGGLETN